MRCAGTIAGEEERIELHIPNIRKSGIVQRKRKRNVRMFPHKERVKNAHHEESVSSLRKC